MTEEQKKEAKKKLTLVLRCLEKIYKKYHKSGCCSIHISVFYDRSDSGVVSNATMYDSYYEERLVDISRYDDEET